MQCQGVDSFKNEFFTRLVLQHQIELNAAMHFRDVPTASGGLSAPLKHKLVEEDLLDIELFLQHWGIKTLHAFQTLESAERSVLLNRARQFYDSMGILHDHRKNILNKVLGDVPHTAWAMVPGIIPHMHPNYWAGWDHHAQPKPLPQEDETQIKSELRIALHGARDLIGEARSAECCRRLDKSNELALASHIEAAEAVAALGMFQFPNEAQKKAYKALKLAVRSNQVWRCLGYILGMDSPGAITKAFKESFRYAQIEEATFLVLEMYYF